MKEFRRLAGLALLLLLASPAAAPAQRPQDAFLAAQQARLERLLGALNWENPALHKVRVAWQRRDLADACQELLTFYQSLSPPSVLTVWPEPTLQQVADDALQDVYSIQGVRGPAVKRTGGGLDWSYRGPRNDPEWAWLFNRHSYLAALSAVWRSTGDPRYAQKANDLLHDWLTANPYPRRISFSPAWRALEAARRILDAWPTTWQQLQSSPQFTPETRLLFLCSLLDHADLLLHHTSFWGGNHLLTEKTALAQLAVAWPEFADSSAWWQQAALSVEREIFAQTYPDGTYKELSDHYHRIVTDNLSRFLEIAGGSPHYHRLIPLAAKAASMRTYLGAVCQPNGWGPTTNAGDREWLRPYSPEPRATPLVALFPYAGQAVLRSSAETSALWVFFDAGPFGSAHQHRDRFHINLSLGEQEILVDAGRYTYRPGVWKEYFCGPNAHNTMLLDGQAALPGPDVAAHPISWTVEESPTGTAITAKAAFPADPLRGRGQVPWIRSVLCRRDGAGLIVVDRLPVFAARELEILWHFAPGLEIQPAGDRWLVQREGATLLEILPNLAEILMTSNILVGVEQPRPAGWHAPDYNHKIPAAELRCRWKARGPSILVWWFHPYSPQPASVFWSSDTWQGMSQAGTISLSFTRETPTITDLPPP